MAPLITIEEATALLPIRTGNTSQNVKLNMLIGTATTMIEQAISRELDKMQRIEYFRTPDTQRSFYDFNGTQNEYGVYSSPRTVRYNLKAFNIDPAALFEVCYDPQRVYGTDTVLPATNYILHRADGLLSIRTAMVDELDSLRVTYTGGYALDSEGTLSGSAPQDIKMACLAQVLHMFGKFTMDNIGKDLDTTQSGTGMRASVAPKFATKAGLVPEALALVTRYKAVGIGLY